MESIVSFKSLWATTLLAAALGLSACSPAVDPDVKARQDSMKSWSDATGIMEDMIDNPNTFDVELFQDQAAFLAEDAASPWSHFKSQEAMGNTTEAVWVNAGTFEAEADQFEQAAHELNAAAQTATVVEDVEPAFNDVKASCKSCHTDFKVRRD